MEVHEPHIDPYLFQRQFEAFGAFVEKKSGVAFISFASNPYTQQQEGYKYEIYRAGREALAFQAWKQSDVGTGEIVDAVIAAIELSGNNLVSWQPRYGKEARPHQPFFESKGRPADLKIVEACLYGLYRDQEDEKSLAHLVAILGKSYPLVAYLCFLKDRSKYLPIAPTFLDRAFQHLGAEFKTSHRCSWENYAAYIGLITELKVMLAESLASEVTLLDAHSFAWMLAAQMEKEHELADVQAYLTLPPTERQAIIKARIGQGRFRESLIEYWLGCAVTGCTEIPLLRASHIKPWAEASIEERLSLYNGLLLSPALDACFDSGYITFSDDGSIIISEVLAAGDTNALGIHPEMRLKKLAPEHRGYLAFHRANKFK